jgi:hypothetical protein
MLSAVVRHDSGARTRHFRPALLASAVILIAAPLSAQTALPPVSVGAGMQTSAFSNTPDGGDTTSNFALNSVRLYVSGEATKNVKFMFNTEYDGGSNHVGVLDAAAQFVLSDKVNIWAGRFLPPSDRANLYGPYYSHHFKVYTDGVQDGYPSVGTPGPTGRDNGVMYWGQFDKIKVSGGVFDGLSATGKTNILSAGRVQVDFWDPEGGYYLNGTYYGGKNLLSVGVAGQVQDGNGAYNGDFLLEKKVSDKGSFFSIEAELAKYDKLGGYDSHNYQTNTGGYVLGSYMFPPMMGLMGNFEVLGKFAKANFTNPVIAGEPDYDQKTTEVNFNYVISEFKARIMVFFLNTSYSAVKTSFKQFGVGVQLQM